MDTPTMNPMAGSKRKYSNEKSLDEEDDEEGEEDVDQVVEDDEECDAIGDTAYSKKWILGFLVKLLEIYGNHPFNHWDFVKQSKEERKENEESSVEAKLEDGDERLEEQLCLLWDMTTDQNVQTFFYTRRLNEVFEFLFCQTQSPRWAEIFMGILANLMAHEALAQEMVTKSTFIADQALDLLQASDALFLRQAMRFLTALLHSKGRTNFIKILDENLDLLACKISYLLANSLDKQLLGSVIGFVNRLLNLGDDFDGFTRKWAQTNSSDLISSLYIATQHCLTGFEHHLDQAESQAIFFKFWLILYSLFMENDQSRQFTEIFVQNTERFANIFSYWHPLLQAPTTTTTTISLHTMSAHFACCQVFSFILSHLMFHRENMRQDQIKMIQDLMDSPYPAIPLDGLRAAREKFQEWLTKERQKIASDDQGAQEENASYMLQLDDHERSSFGAIEELSNAISVLMREPR